MLETPRRRARVTSAIALAVAVLAFGPAGLHAAREAPGETHDGRAATIRIEPAEHAMLVGDRVKLWARVCDEDGRRCRPAKRARWRYEPPELVMWTARRGAVVVVESIGQAGTLVATARQEGATGTSVITIGEPGGLVEAEIERSDLYLYVLPEQASLDVGAFLRLDAWGCPIDTSTDLGANRVPDGADDACEPLDISSVVLDEHAPLRVTGVRGASAVVQLTGYPGLPGTSRWPLTVQVVTPAGVAVPGLQARDQVAGVVSPIELSEEDR